MRTVVVLCTVFLTATVAAFDLELGPDGLADALAIGQTGIESRRAQFHQPYRLIVNRPPLDYVEVITPFRRVALAAEARLRSGERLFGQREALAVLGDMPERVELRLELTFNPLNTFIGVPAYGVELLTTAGQKEAPRSVDRVPRFGPRVEGQVSMSPTAAVATRPGTTQPLTGGTIIADFDGRRLDRTGAYDIVIRDGDSEIARARMNLADLR